MTRQRGVLPDKTITLPGPALTAAQLEAVRVALAEAVTEGYRAGWADAEVTIGEPIPFDATPPDPIPVAPDPPPDRRPVGFRPPERNAP